MGLIERIIEKAPPGTVIPKPKTDRQEVIGWGWSKGEEALVYSIPNKKCKAKQSTKRIKVSDFEDAYKVLMKTGQLTREWFNQNLPDCAKGGDCNFTTIGGIFCLLGDAVYWGSGVHCRKSNTAVE